MVSCFCKYFYRSTRALKSLLQNCLTATCKLRRQHPLGRYIYIPFFAQGTELKETKLADCLCITCGPAYRFGVTGYSTERVPKKDRYRQCTKVEGNPEIALFPFLLTPFHSSNFPVVTMGFLRKPF